MAQVQQTAAVGGPAGPGVSTAVPSQSIIPFHRAAGPVRTVISVADTGKALTTSQQSIPQVLPGDGYLVDLEIEAVFTATGNASTNTVALAEDAPWAGFANVTLDDGGPQMVNLDGYSLWLLNEYGGFGMGHRSGSSDTNVYNAISTGTGSGAGSGRFSLVIPAAINRRSYWGVLGNQDRATKYNLRDDLAASTSIFATAPSALPSVDINRFYHYLPVPGPVGADGRPQQQVPATYGIVHYMTAVKAAEAPSPSSTVQHYLRNLNNAVRTLILVFRAGTGTTPRATANANMPTRISFKIGRDVLFTSTVQDIRRKMYDRYGVDAPSGVLVLDFLDDFGQRAGYELGDKYLYLGNVTEAQVEVTYPSGFEAGGSLTMITDSLYIPPTVDIYGLGA